MTQRVHVPFPELPQALRKNKMATQITPADILKERDEKRKAGILAHSANVNGDFMARLNCPCYTCRDCLDPTGEEDAKAANTPSAPPPPSPPMTLLAAASGSWVAPPPDHLGDAIHSIKALIEDLKKKQDAVYDDDANSHSDMSIQDMEWDEYDTKIMALTQALEILENFA